MVTGSDIPSEVWEAVYIASCGAVGLEMYNRYQEIVKKYPEHFPWETKYNSIPSEVHKAYAIERDGGTFEELIAKAKANALENPTFSENRIDTSKPFSFRDVFDTMVKNENERREKKIEQEKKNKTIWDKHYSKYNLEYIGSR